MIIQATNYPYNYLRTSNKRSSTPYYQDTVSFSAYHNQKVKRRKKAQKIGAFLSALTVGIAGTAGIALKINTTATPSENFNNNETTPPSSYVSKPYETEETTLPPYTTSPTEEPTIEQTIPQTTQSTEPEPISVEEIFKLYPEVEEQYKKITEALNTYSSHLGEDALPIIKQKVEELGNDKVEVIDVLKILWIESTGRIYDKNGDILKSDAGAYGAFQVTKDTQDFLNNYYGITLDVEDPYDNLEACIYNLRFIHGKRSNDLENGQNLPTGDSLKTAIAWSYHDGPWATKITDYGQDYINKFSTLSQIDEFPQVIDYIINGGE